MQTLGKSWAIVVVIVTWSADKLTIKRYKLTTMVSDYNTRITMITWLVQINIKLSVIKTHFFIVK